MSNPSLVLNKADDISFEDYPIPSLKNDHSVLVEVKKTGICGSDIHYYAHGKIGDFVLTSPMVLGHESSGVVSKVGKDVKSVKVGDKVAIEPGVPLRLSSEYKSGHYNLCPCMQFAATPSPEGVTNPPGTLCKYFESPEDFLVKLPDHISLELGAMVEPMSVGVHANRMGKVSFGDRVVVMGAGPVGILAAAVSRAFGATSVMVCDIQDSKMELAKSIGAATHSYNVKNGDAKGLIRAFDGEAPSVVIECSGAAPSVKLAAKVVGNLGRYVQVGNPSDDVAMPLVDIINKEATIFGSFRYAAGDYRTSVEILSENYRDPQHIKVDFEKLITDRYSWKDAIKAYDKVRAGESIKCIIDGPE